MSKDIHFALDLGFSDGHGGENVREHTIIGHGTALADAIDLLSLEGAVNFSLLNKLGADHPSPEIYALDFPSDAKASMYVLLGGYYKQAILCLRSWLEMRLLGIYFGIIDRSKYDDWKHGRLTKTETPYGVNLVGKIFGRAEFWKAQARNGARARLEALYGDLSIFSHGQGVKKFNLQDETDNVPRYNPKSVDLYLQLLKRAFDEIVYCMWLAYGDKALASLLSTEAILLPTKLRSEYASEMHAALLKVTAGSS